MSDDSENAAQNAADDILAEFEAAAAEATAEEAIAAPKTEAPKTEAPKTEAPKTEAPEIEDQLKMVDDIVAESRDGLPTDAILTEKTLQAMPQPELSLEERFQGKAREICYQVLDQVLEEQIQGEFKAHIENKVKELLLRVLEEQSLSLIQGGGAQNEEQATPKPEENKKETAAPKAAAAPKKKAA